MQSSYAENNSNCDAAAQASEVDVLRLLSRREVVSRIAVEAFSLSRLVVSCCQMLLFFSEAELLFERAFVARFLLCCSSFVRVVRFACDIFSEGFIFPDGRTEGRADARTDAQTFLGTFRHSSAPHDSKLCLV